MLLHYGADLAGFWHTIAPLIDNVVRQIAVAVAVESYISKHRVEGSFLKSSRHALQRRTTSDLDSLCPGLNCGIGRQCEAIRGTSRRFQISNQFLRFGAIPGISG